MANNKHKYNHLLPKVLDLAPTMSASDIAKKYDVSVDTIRRLARRHRDSTGEEVVFYSSPRTGNENTANVKGVQKQDFSIDSRLLKTKWV